MASKMTVALIVLLFAIGAAIAQPTGDRVTSLPNLAGKLGVQYSGYVPVNTTTGQYLHYWFVQSTNSPSTDPLVLWMNGGPGCSSLDGYFYEQGPLHFTQDNEDNLTLIDNPWTWARVANVIFLEAPAGVGFSYSKTPSDYNTNDDITAHYNHIFLQTWFSLYPQFKKNDFYIAGESYAGIYVPTLAHLVAQDSSINFKGILVGNGVTDSTLEGMYNSYLPFLFGHGIFSKQTYHDIEKYCVTSPNKQQCQQLMSVVWENMADIDIYDLYTDCFHQRPIAGSHLPHPINSLLESSQLGDTVPCIDSTKAERYLAMASVKSAIHVKQDITWAICTSAINYTNVYNTVVPIYKELISKKYRILVYSGDVDGAVPYTGTENWTSSLGLPVKRSWKQWHIPKWDGSQVAGYVTDYEGLTFATVKGSGHMVPQFKPEAGFYMFSRFLSGTPL